MDGGLSKKSPQGLGLDQQQAWYHLTSTQENLFLTGGAGTGKSFVMQEFRNYLAAKGCGDSTVVVASTGAAALLLGGRTFHSFFGLGIMQGGLGPTMERALADKKLRRRLRKVETLIIDEISMVPFEALDCAEAVSRAHRASDRAWGGIRVLMVGDFFQLAPVSRESTKPWAFLGEAWACTAPKRLVLSEVLRVREPQMIQRLHEFRKGELSAEGRDFLEAHSSRSAETDSTYLFPRRFQAEDFNHQKLENIPGKAHELETIYSGVPRFVERLQLDCPVPPILRLKKGAQVMLRMNDPKQRFVNGSLAVVKDFKRDRLVLELPSRDIELEPFTFSVVDADGLVVATATNFPVTLAYASTIHKAQGATIDRVSVDLKGLWEPGQAYVALSRVRSEKGLHVLSWSPSSFRSDPMVQEFYAC